MNHTDPVFLAGFGDNRRATGYHDRLWARGLVLDSKGVRVAIVAVDLIGYFKNEIDTARALVSPASEIDFVVVSSTHQHEGPDTIGIWGPDALTTGIDFGYLDFVNGGDRRLHRRRGRRTPAGAGLLRHREQRGPLDGSRRGGRWLRRLRRQGPRG